MVDAALSESVDSNSGTPYYPISQGKGLVYIGLQMRVALKACVDWGSL